MINAANSQKKTSGLLYRGSSFLLQLASFILLRHVIFFPPPPQKKTFSPADTQKSILLLPCHNTWAASTNFESYSTRPFSLSLVLARGRLLSTSTQIAVTMGGVAGQREERSHTTQKSLLLFSFSFALQPTLFFAKKKRERANPLGSSARVTSLPGGRERGDSSPPASPSVTFAPPDHKGEVWRGGHFSIFWERQGRGREEGGQARGYCSCQRRHQREVAKREEGTNQKSYSARGEGERERERERVRWEGVGSTGRFTPPFGLLGSSLAHRRSLARKGGGGLAFEGSGEGGLYISRTPLCSTVRIRSFPWPSPPPPATEKQ